MSAHARHSVCVPIQCACVLVTLRNPRPFELYQLSKKKTFFSLSENEITVTLEILAFRDRISLAVFNHNSTVRTGDLGPREWARVETGS